MLRWASVLSKFVPEKCLAETTIKRLEATKTLTGAVWRAVNHYYGEFWRRKRHIIEYYAFNNWRP